MAFSAKRQPAAAEKANTRDILRIIQVLDLPAAELARPPRHMPGVVQVILQIASVGNTLFSRSKSGSQFTDLLLDTIFSYYAREWARPRAEALREAAIAGNSSWAALAETQPAVLPPDEAVGNQELRPLRFPTTPPASSRIALGIVLMILAVVTLVVVLPSPVTFSNLLSAGDAVCLPFSLIFALAGIWLLWQGIGLLRPGSVQVSHDGLSWQVPGRGHVRQLRWHDAQACFLIRHGGFLTHQATTILVSSDATLVWSVFQHTSKRRATTATRLTQLIAYQTGLPLRDLTGYANELASSPPVSRG